MLPNHGDQSGTPFATRIKEKANLVRYSKMVPPSCAERGHFARIGQSDRLAITRCVGGRGLPRLALSMGREHEMSTVASTLISELEDAIETNMS
jgi:hypothetical protein